jgi:hypothetical protein
MEYFIAGIFMIISLYLITQPLFNPGRDREPGNLDCATRREDHHTFLQAKKRLLEENITELEFEYRMGKLSKKDFDRLQAGGASEANDLRRALAEFRADKDMDERIEQEILKKRKLG